MKNHDKVNELLAGFILGELTKEQAREVQEHLDNCPACRQEAEQMKMVLACADRMSGLSADESMCADAKGSVLNGVKNEDNSTTASVPGVVRIFERKNIMQSKSMKVAVAAVIIIGVFIGLNMLGISPDGSSVAWAEVAELVEQAKTVAYRMHMKMKGMPGCPKDKEMELDYKVKMSSDYGMRMDATMDGKAISQTYILFAENSLISIMPEQKKFMRMTLTDDLLEKMRKESGNPKEMVAEFMKLDYIELGSSEIDGVEVEGVETNDPKMVGGMFENFVARLWVEVETGLPVLMEMEYVSDDGSVQMDMVMDGFEWNIEFDTSEFAHVIPADYESIGDIKMPEMNEESAIKGLRAIVEITGGKYPKSLNPIEIATELGNIQMKERKARRRKIRRAKKEAIAAGIDPNTIPEVLEAKKEMEEKLEGLIEDQMAMQGVYMFYMHLVTEEKDPAYFGDRVTPEDTGEVLMRWLNDDGGYRVIFGDLSIGDLSPEELGGIEGQMEAQLAEPVME